MDRSPAATEDLREASRFFWSASIYIHEKPCKRNQQINIADMMRSSGVAFGTSGARGLVAQMTPEVCCAYATAF
jgi:hypothetical protein